MKMSVLGPPESEKWYLQKDDGAHALSRECVLYVCRCLPVTESPVKNFSGTFLDWGAIQKISSFKRSISLIE